MKALILTFLLIYSYHSMALPGMAAKPEIAENSHLIEKANVYVGTSRAEMMATTKPWSAFGRMLNNGIAWCSATLVGPDLVMTAAHCVLDANGKLLGGLRFDAGYRRGKALASAGVIYIWSGAHIGSDTNNDWAILKLDARIGDQMGWLGVLNMTNSQLVLLAGAGLVAYPGDKNSEAPFYETGCRFRSLVAERIYVRHDCSTSRGTSGGAMFVQDAATKRFYIVALNVAEARTGDQSQIGVIYSDETANYAVPASQFVNTLQQVSQL